MRPSTNHRGVFHLSVYLDMLFDDEPYEARVDRVASLGVDGFETFGFDRDLAAIGERRDEHGLDWVYASGDRPPLTDPDRFEDAVENVEWSIDLAERYDIANLNVKAGPAQEDLAHDTQWENTVAVLEAVAPAAEDAGVDLVLEPLNTHVDHPEQFLATASAGFEIVEAVDSPGVRLLFDVYHEQIMAGDVTRRLTENVDLVGHVHVADNPGRHEPGTGELNYANVLAALAETGYDGYVGCEFEPTVDGDAAVRHVRSLVPSSR